MQFVRMRMEEIGARLSARMEEITQETGVAFPELFSQAVARAAETPAAEESDLTDLTDLTDPTDPTDLAGLANGADIAAVPERAAGTYPYESLIVSAAESYGVDPALVRALIQVESGFDPGLISSAGAMGLMQLMPETAEALGVQNALDPAQNIDGGIRCLLGQIIRFDGDVRTALAAYNCGANGLKVRNVTDAGDPAQAARLPAETQNYLKKIEAALAGMGRGALLTDNFFA
jgi:soluble lytic murein transglycosylase-like protein